MKQKPQPKHIQKRSLIFLLTAPVLLAVPLVAQESESASNGQATSQAVETGLRLTMDEVDSALAAVEANSEIEEAQKATLQTKYKQIKEVLQQAEEYASKTTAYKAALETAPPKAAENRAQQEALPSVEEAARVDVQGSSTDVRKELEVRQAELKGMVDEFERVAAELLKAEGRPVEIATRLPAAQRELATLQNRLEAPEPTPDAASPTATADRLLLRAEYTRLANEIEMMQQEQLSQSVREDELKSRRDLLARQVENAKATISVFASRLETELTSDVDRIRALAEQASGDLPGDTAVQALAAEVNLLAQQFEDVVKYQKQVLPAGREVKDRLEEVGGEYRSVRNEVNLGSGGPVMTQVLHELSRRARTSALQQQLPISVERARLEWFAIKGKRRGQSEVETRFADHPSASVQQLVAARLEILAQLQVESANLTKALAALQTDKQHYFDLCREVQTYVAERLFGFKIRSCPAIGFETLTGIPSGLAWLFRAENWTEIGAAISLRPFVNLAVLLLVIVLLLLRRRLIAALEATGPPIRRVSTDRYVWTAKALLWTALLAAPASILFGLITWILKQPSDPSDWMVGIGDGFEYVTGLVVVAAFICEVCRPIGLGIIHFRWNKELSARVSLAIKSIGIAYVPLMILISGYTFGQASQYLDSVGRTAFILVHIWMVFVLWKTLYRYQDVIASQTSNSNSRISRFWQGIRMPLLVGTPLVLIALSCLGYLMTAVELSFGLCASAGIIGLGRILDNLTLRWFKIRQRRLALAEAIKERRARLAAAAEERSEQDTSELLHLDEEEELGLNLDAASDQTKAFLHLFFNLIIIAVLYRYWSLAIPLTATLDTIPIPLAEGLSLLTLVKALLVGIVTVVAVRNLPGLLEFTVLRTSTIGAGTRNAIYTLCQYAVIGIALIALSNVLNLDWAKLGWMAAALSVGLGFGLQEVVANFVSGLIVLFERPIRVGDIVTIEGTTGTVTNINMRATTITNWDRQDFVVPNKNLITGTILNWTLSAPVNRIVIPVGVAYGSDTEQARQILLGVAADHPEVLDDPKPLATFEQFGDSSLNLMLRAYLPNLDNRVGTITELHTEIAKRFAAAGIEIPFPQRDLHFRSGADKISPTVADTAQDTQDSSPEPEAFGIPPR